MHTEGSLSMFQTTSRFYHSAVEKIFSPCMWLREKSGSGLEENYGEVVSCPDPTREERIWWCLTDLSGLINVDCFPWRIFKPPIMLQKTGWNTGNSWLFHSTMWYHSSFLACKLVISSTMHTVSYEFLIKPEESARMSPDPPLGSEHETMKKQNLLKWNSSIPIRRCWDPTWMVDCISHLQGI